MPDNRYSNLLISSVFGIVISTLLLAFSCATNKASVESSLNPVVLKFQQHTPYCGGAYPTPEQQRGWISPIANQQYAIFRAPNDNVIHTQIANTWCV